MKDPESHSDSDLYSRGDDFESEADFIYRLIREFILVAEKSNANNMQYLTEFSDLELGSLYIFFNSDCFQTPKESTETFLNKTFSQETFLRFSNLTTIWSGNKIVRIDKNATTTGFSKFLYIRDYKAVHKSEFDKLLRVSSLEWLPNNIINDEHITGTIFKIDFQPQNSKIKLKWIKKLGFEGPKLLFSMLSVEKIAFYNLIGNTLELKLTISIASSSLLDIRKFRNSIKFRLKEANLGSEQITTVSHIPIEMVSQSTTEILNFLVVFILPNLYEPKSFNITSKINRVVVSACASVSDPDFFTTNSNHFYVFHDYLEINGVLPVFLNASIHSLNYENSFFNLNNDTFWNSAIIENWLPLAYMTLLKEFMDQRLVQPYFIYSLFPNPESVNPQFSILANNILKRILTSTTAVYAEDLHGGSWTDSLRTFIFNETTWSAFTDLIVKIISKCRETVSVVPSHVVKSLKIIFNEKLRNLTQLNVGFLIRGFSLDFLSRDERLLLLGFLATEDDFKDLIGLQLAPTVDGNFSLFKGNHDDCKLYVNSNQVDSEVVEIFKDKFIDYTIPPELQQILYQVASSGVTQLCFIDNVDLPKLIRTRIDEKLLEEDLGIESEESLEKNINLTWKIVQDWSSHSLSNISEVLLVPLMDSGGRIHVSSINNDFIASSYENDRLDENVCILLKHLDSPVVEDPLIVETLMRMNSPDRLYIRRPNERGVVEILDRLRVKKGCQTLKSKILEVPKNIRTYFLTFILSGDTPLNAYELLTSVGFENESEIILKNAELSTNKKLKNQRKCSVSFYDQNSRFNLKTDCTPHSFITMYHSDSESRGDREYFEGISEADVKELFLGLEESQNRNECRVLRQKFNLEDITAVDIKYIVEYVETQNEPYVERISSLLILLESNEHLLYEKLDNLQLKDYLITAKWLPCITQTPPEYPKFLPLYGKTTRQSLFSPPDIELRNNLNFIGSVSGVHRFTFSTKLASILKINKFLPLHNVKDHYSNIMKYHQSARSVEFNKYVEEYYSELFTMINSHVVDPDALVSQFPRNWLWNGHHFIDFQCPRLYLTNFLKPLSRFLNLFQVNCEEDLYSYLSLMEEKYANKISTRSDLEIQMDLSAIISSVEDFVEFKNSNERVQLEKMFLPVCNDSNQDISFARGSDCTYCQPYILENLILSKTTGVFGKYNILHQRFSRKVAEILRITTWYDELMEIKTGKERQNNHRSLLVKEIFRFGESIGSSEIKFMYDDRKLVTSGRETGNLYTKSSSLWIYFNSSLPSSFFELSNIQILNFLRIISENICILSLNLFVEYNFKSEDPPFRINISNCPKMTLEHIEILSNFDGLFGCRISPRKFYSGTLIRCPLSESHFSDPRNPKIVPGLFVKHLFMDIIDLSLKLMLYLEGISRTSIYTHGGSKINDCCLLFNLNKYYTEMLQKPTKRIVSEDLSIKDEILKFNSAKLGELISLYPTSVIPKEKILIFTSYAYNFKGSVTEIGQRFIDCENVDFGDWALLTTIQLVDLYPRSTLAVSYIAVPYTISNKNRTLEFGNSTFSTLKTEETGLPLCFHLALTGHRDKKGVLLLRHIFTRQHEEILQAYATDGYLIFLEYLCKSPNKLDSIGDLYSFWPFHVSSEYLPTVYSIYRQIFKNRSKNIYFPPINNGATSKIAIFDQSVYECPLADDIIHIYEKTRGFSILKNIPQRLISYIKQFLPEKMEAHCMLDLEASYAFIFRILKDIDEGRRNKLVIYALTTLFETVGSKLSQIPCIPVNSGGMEFKCPQNLVEPVDDFILLFEDVKEEIFPIKVYVEDQTVVESLRKLGMTSEFLSWTQIIERLDFILSKDNKHMKMSRIQILFKFIHKNLTRNVPCPQKIKNILTLSPIFPVKHTSGIVKPDFAASNDVYLPGFESCVSILYSIVDLEAISVFDKREIFNFFDLTHRRPTVSAVIDNLLALPYLMNSSQDAEVEMYANDIYDFLNDSVNEGNNVDLIWRKLENKEWVYFEGKFMGAHKLCFSNLDCPPYIYKVSSGYLLRHKSLLQKLGSKEEFMEQDFIQVLRRIEIDNRRLDSKLIEKYKTILMAFLDALYSSGKDPKEYQLIHGQIFLPDINGDLVLSSRLVYDDCGLKNSVDPSIVKILGSFFVIHWTIPHNIAASLGVKNLGDEVIKYDITTINLPAVLTDRIIPSNENLLVLICSELLKFFDQIGCSRVKVTLDLREDAEEDVFREKVGIFCGSCLCFEIDMAITDVHLNSLIEKYYYYECPLRDQGVLGFAAGTLISRFISVYSKFEDAESLEILEFKMKSNKIIQKTTKKYKNVDVLRNLFSETYLLFTANQISAKNTTVFRFPLNAENILNFQLKNHRNGKVEDELNISAILTRFFDLVPYQLIFLENVRSVSSHTISKNSTKMTNSCVSSAFKGTGDISMRDYYQKLSKARESYFSLNSSLSSVKRMFCLYQVSVTVNRTTLFTWFCCDVFGFNSIKRIPVTPIKIQDSFFPFPRAVVALSTNEFCLEPGFDPIFCSGTLILAQSKLEGLLICGNFMLDLFYPRLDCTVSYREDWNSNLILNLCVEAHLLILSHFKMSLAMNPRSIFRYFPPFSLELLSPELSQQYLTLFYGLLCQNSYELFPYVDDTSFVFWENVENVILYSEDSKQNELRRVLKNKIKFVDVPPEKYEILRKYAPPNYHLTFGGILSFFRKRKNCIKPNEGLSVVSNLTIILNFLIETGPRDIKLEGTPLVLTADSQIHIASSDEPKFLFEYNKIFGDSKDLFVHRKLIEVYQNCKFANSGEFLQFDIEDFIHFVMKNKKLKNQLTLDSQNSFIVLPTRISSMELQVLWNSMDSLFQSFCRKHNLVSPDEIRRQFLTQFEEIGHWCILPAVTWDLNSQIMRKQLFSLTGHGKIIKISSTNSTLVNFMIRSGLPQPDDSLINCCFYNQIISDIGDPRCVEQLFKVFIRNDIVPAEHEYFEVLRFISQLMEDNMDDSTVNLLRQLKIFRTLDGGIISLPNIQPCICVETQFSVKEARKWCLYNNSVLLCSKMKEFGQILKFVNCKVISAISVYIEMILPRWDILHGDSHLDNLDSIRELLENNHKDHAELLLFSESLTTTPLIYDGGNNLRLIGDLYDPELTTLITLSELSNIIEFPHSDYSTRKWLPFLRRLGIKEKLNPKELLNLGDILSNSDQSPEKISEFSKNIYYSCLQSIKTEDELKIVERLQFFKSDHTTYDFLSLFSENTTKGTSMSLRGGALWKHRNLVSTIFDILPEWIIETDETRGFLEMAGVIIVLSPTTVVDNVAHLAARLELFDFAVPFEMMCGILGENFEFLSKCPLSNDSIQSLRDLPIVPTNSKRFVKPKYAFFSLKGSLVIPNYMETVNSRFYGFMPFFKKIGVLYWPDLSFHARILGEFKDIDRILTPNEIKFTLQATKALLILLIESSQTEIDDFSDSSPELYFPCRKGTLQESHGLIYVDNMNLFSRTASTMLDCKYFVNHNECDLNWEMYVKAIELIPPKWRPKRLSNVVVEKIDLNSLNLKRNMSDDEFSTQLKTRLSGERFLSGVERILVSSAMDREWALNKSDIKKYRSRIQVVEVIPLLRITTYLFHQDEIIAESESSSDCFFHSNHDYSESFIYIRQHILSETRLIINLAGIINRICDNLLATRKDLVVHILTCPVYDIERELNYLSLPRNEEILSRLSTLPLAGSLVPSSQYDYLYNKCLNFNVDEYVGIVLPPKPNFNGDILPVYGVLLSSDVLDPGLWSVKIGSFSDDVIKLSTGELLKITVNSFDGDKYSVRQPSKNHFTETKERPEDSRENGRYQFPQSSFKSKNNEKFTKINREKSFTFDENPRHFFKQTSYTFTEGENEKFSSKKNGFSENLEGDTSTSKNSKNSWEIKEEIRRKISEAKRFSIKERKKLIKKLLLKWHPDKNPNDPEFSTTIFQLIQKEIETTSLFDDSKRNPWEYMGFSGWDKFYEFVKKRAKSKDNDSSYGSSESPPFQESKQSFSECFDISVIKSRTWFSQAVSDLKTASTLNFSVTGSYEWMTFIACQAAEKAIKAVYIKMFNTRQVDHMTNLLVILYEIKDERLNEYSKSLNQISFKNPRGLYPEKITAPHSMATRLCAEEAVKLSKEVIQYIRNKYFDNFENSNGTS